MPGEIPGCMMRKLLVQKVSQKIYRPACGIRVKRQGKSLPFRKQFLRLTNLIRSKAK